MTFEERLRTFKEVHRKQGLKITHQRLEIFKELLSSHDHPTVEKLYSRLKSTLPTISLDTIYRTLATLEQLSLVARVQTLENPARFEGKMEQHHHVICRKCGEITDFYWSFFDEVSLPDKIKSWGLIEQKNITLHGLCRACAEHSKIQKE